MVVATRHCSIVPQVVDDIERVVNNEPLDGVGEVCNEHLLAVADLLGLSIIVILYLELVHVELRNTVIFVQAFHELFFTQQVELPQISSRLDFQRKILNLVRCKLRSQLQCI